MIVLVFFIIAAVLFGLDAIFPIPSRTDYHRTAVALGLCAVAIALAVWHGAP